ncbi:MAG: formylglycine-generating enzyme family protein [Pseudomonadota bacterium]
MIEMKTALRVRGPALSTLAVLSAAMLLLTLPEMAASETYTLSDGRTVETLEIFQECDVCPEMIVLPLGSFTMGAPPSEGADLDEVYRRQVPGGYWEGPEHPVVIDLPIAASRNEITYGEWMNCVAEGGCSHSPDPVVLTPNGQHTIGSRAPVINVSYLDILEYATWLNGKIALEVYRLPTEAEWEYAARAGTETPFAQGQELSTDQANFVASDVDPYDPTIGPNSPSPMLPIPVDDREAANTWGLRHMSGNVNELTIACWSIGHRGLASSSEYLSDAEKLQTCDRVTKGGGYGSGSSFARPANRGFSPENHRSRYTGFRLIRVMQ